MFSVGSAFGYISYADKLKNEKNTKIIKRGEQIDLDGPVNWGHCGVSLGDGRVIHAWDMIRIDDYRNI